MTESYIALPIDGSGKKIRTSSSTIGTNEVHQQIVSVDPNLSSYSATITISGGSGSHATTTSFDNYLKHLLIKPTTSTTTYKFQITDADGFVIFNRTEAVTTGNFSWITPMPLYGIITFTFSSVSADESISVKLVYE